MAAEQSDTIVGANVELTGSLRNTGPIHIFGKVTGDITSDGLIVVGESAIINGPVSGRQVDVSGKVVGSIMASEQVELQPKSVVKGDITTAKLSIKPGATFNGKSKMNIGSSQVDEEEYMISDKRKPRLEIE